jgi:hypothetical protein
MIPHSELVRLAREHCAEAYQNFSSEEYIFTIDGITALAEALLHHGSRHEESTSGSGSAPDGDV